ncbi:MAG: flagellar basal-body rod protein FlgF [Vampirovibrionia bacterium]
MIRGLYSAASGMVGMLGSNDTLANNLANINTPGFKKGITIFKSFAPLLLEKVSTDGNDKSQTGQKIGSLSTGSAINNVSIDFSQGRLKQTDRNYDLALEGKGFFEVRTDSGQTLYTRDGSFERSQDGYLVTREGHKVIGVNNKPIMLGTSVIDFQVNGDGTVALKDATGTIAETDQTVNKIKLVEFENNQALSRMGTNLYADSGAAGPKLSEGSRVVQGSLEMSNANVINTMVKSIEGMRTYETLARVVETTGKNLEKVTTQLGKV